MHDPHGHHGNPHTITGNCKTSQVAAEQLIVFADDARLVPQQQQDFNHPSFLLNFLLVLV